MCLSVCIRHICCQLLTVVATSCSRGSAVPKLVLALVRPPKLPKEIGELGRAERLLTDLPRGLMEPRCSDGAW